MISKILQVSSLRNLPNWIQQLRILSERVRVMAPTSCMSLNLALRYKDAINCLNFVNCYYTFIIPLRIALILFRCLPELGSLLQRHDVRVSNRRVQCEGAEVSCDMTLTSMPCCPARHGRAGACAGF
jgi:hypothetical protein